MYMETTLREITHMKIPHGKTTYINMYIYIYENCTRETTHETMYMKNMLRKITFIHLSTLAAIVLAAAVGCTP